MRIKQKPDIIFETKFPDGYLRNLWKLYKNEKIRHANIGYSSLLLTFLTENPRKFAISGLRRNSSAEPFRNETIAQTVMWN